MRKTLHCALAVAVLYWSQFVAADDQTPEARRGSAAIGSIAEKTEGMKKIDGFFPVYWEESERRPWLEPPRLQVEVLQSSGYATGSARTISAAGYPHPLVTLKPDGTLDHA